MDLSKKTTEELKALAYDLIITREQTGNNLNVIITEINKRLENSAEISEK